MARGSWRSRAPSPGPGAAPAEDAPAFSVVCRLRRPSAGVISRSDRSVTGPRTERPHPEPAGRHPTAVGAQALPQDAAISAIHMNSPVARKRCPAASGDVIARMWMSTRSRTSTISSDTRDAAHLPGHHAHDDADRADGARRQDGAEHGAREHGHQFGRARMAADEIQAARSARSSSGGRGSGPGRRGRSTASRR